MIVIRQPDGTHDVHITAAEAGAMQGAILRARPSGSASTPDKSIRVHVHAKAADAPKVQDPIEVK